MFGVSGNDQLTGGMESDALYARGCADTFYFGDNWGTDGLRKAMD